VTQKEENEARIAVMTDDELTGLMEQMTAYAVRLIKAVSWRGSQGGILPNGEDGWSVAQTAFMRLLNGAKWDEDKPMWLVLRGIIRGRIQSLCKSKENQLTEGLRDGATKEEENEGLDREGNLADPIASNPRKAMMEQEDEAILMEIIEQLDADGREEESKIISAIVDGALKRTEILELTGLGEQVYEAAKKRLRRGSLKDFRQNLAFSDH